MTHPKATPFIDHSIASMSGASQALIAVAGWDTVTERVVSNPSATESLWIAFDQPAAANGAGSILVGPGQTVSFQTTSAVNVLGTATAPVTAYERVP